jgi:hypothetical protein
VPVAAASDGEYDGHWTMHAAAGVSKYVRAVDTWVEPESAPRVREGAG